MENFIKWHKSCGYTGSRILYMKFVTSINIYKLIEQAVYKVYNTLPDQIKSFLLSMSIYNNSRRNRQLI